MSNDPTSSPSPPGPEPTTLQQSVPTDQNLHDSTTPETNLPSPKMNTTEEFLDFLIGEYRVIKELGRGGMGIVYLANDEKIQRSVAIKIMYPELAALPSFRERFLREARSAGQLHHDHIVPIYHVGEDKGVPFLVMPLLQGSTLQSRMAGPSMTFAEILEISRQIVRGLEAAHSNRIIHRDIKPANIWLETIPVTSSTMPLILQGSVTIQKPVQPTFSWRIKILDFGLACPMKRDESTLTRPGMILGTPAYMSPEQASGQDLDHRTDLFSLGCVLYQLATKQLPFQGHDLTSIIRAHALDDPKPVRKLNPKLPEAFANLIHRLLAKDPTQRPASATEVRDELRAIAESYYQISLPDPPVILPSREISEPTPRHRVWVVGLLVLFALATFFLTRSSSSSSSIPPVPPAAFKGYVDLRVWSKAGKEDKHNLNLLSEGAVPLEEGDRFRLSVQLNRKGYLYLFWIGTNGRVQPIYPWTPDQWGTRPSQEEAIETLELPSNRENGWKISPASTGMESVVLLVRETPWELTDEQIQALFRGLPEQKNAPKRDAVAWLENGSFIYDEPDRRTRGFTPEETKLDDPILTLQGIIKNRIQEHASYIRGVAFPVAK